MDASVRQEQFRSRGKHLILYDGVCGLCNRLNRFVLSKDQWAIFEFATLQNDTGRAFLSHFGKPPGGLDTFCLVTDHRGASPKLLCESRAALAVLGNLGTPWRWLSSFLELVPKPVLDWGYRIVAQNRYRLLGQSASCALPALEYSQRFVDYEFEGSFLTNGKLPASRDAISLISKRGRNQSIP